MRSTGDSGATDASLALICCLRVMDASRLKRVILSLPDAALRLGWLESELEGLGSAASAALLNEIMEQNEAAAPDAREALLTIASLLVRPDNREVVEALRSEAVERK